MNNKEIHKKVIVILGIIAFSYLGYQWDKSRKLDDYFVQQFCLDYLLQSDKGDPGHEGPVAKEAIQEMKELGYNPYEIQQIFNKGMDLALEKKEKYRKAESWLKDHKQS